MSSPSSPRLVSELFGRPGVCLSYEFFPPKDKGGFLKFFDTVAELKSACRPDFCSVTWGAGGSTIRHSLDVVSHLTHGMGLLTVAHFTGLGMTRNMADEFLLRFEGTGIHNLLVLRGDRPHGQAGDAASAATSPTNVSSDGFRHASELVAYIRSKPDHGRADLAVLVAGYPEGHPESRSADADWDRLADKVRQGADGIVTQFFFENSAFFRFRDGLKSRDVKAPVAVGVMMVTKARSIRKMVELSKCAVPADLAAAIERYEQDDASMEAFGVDYAARQVSGLMDQGVNNFHIYTLNQAGPTIKLLSALKGRIGVRPPAPPRTVHVEYREYMAYPDSKLTDLFKKYGLDPDQPHSIVHNHALRRYEITQ